MPGTQQEPSHSDFPPALPRVWFFSLACVGFVPVANAVSSSFEQFDLSPPSHIMACTSTSNPMCLLCFVSFLGKQHPIILVYSDCFQEGTDAGNDRLDARMFSCPLILMLFPVLTNLITSGVLLRSCCNNQRELRDHLILCSSLKMMKLDPVEKDLAPRSSRCGS